MSSKQVVFPSGGIQMQTLIGVLLAASTPFIVVAILKTTVGEFVLSIFAIIAIISAVIILLAVATAFAQTVYDKYQLEKGA